MRQLLIATTNEDKLRELLDGFGELPFTVLTLADFPSAGDVDESASTLEGNALIKAFIYGKRTGKLTFAEDTGLEVDALHGRPGVATARYAENAEARNAKLLNELLGVEPERRGARFRTAFAIYDPERGDRIVTGEGSVEGRITEVRRGDTWGYDPIFEVTALGKTFGEISPEQKNIYSHRALAVQRAKAVLKDLI